MHVRLTRVQGPTPEALEAYVERLRPALQQMPGIERAYLLLDREEARGAVVAFYRDREAMQAAAAAAARLRDDADEAMPLFDIAVDEYEVIGEV